MRVKPAKKPSMQQTASTAAADNRLVEGRPAEGQHSNDKAAEKHEGETEGTEDGLGGLLGAYGSDSEQE